MGRRRVALGVFTVALVAVPLALARSSLLAQARITGSETNWTLTIQNISTDGKSIRCIRYFLPSGATLNNVTSPIGVGEHGWGSTGSTSGDFGFRQEDPGILPGQSLAIYFTTTGPLTAGGTLHYSSDCVEDIVTDVEGPTPVTPPPPPAPPPPPPNKKPRPKPKPKPCKCLNLSVKLDPALLNKKIPPDKHNFGVGITWIVTCTKGKGGCAGLLRFSPPKVLAGSIPEHPGLKLNLKIVTFACATKCATSRVGRFEIKMLSADQLNKLFGRTLAFTVETKCGKTVKKVLVKVLVDNTGRLKPVPAPPPPPPPTASISEDDTWAYNTAIGKGNICINVRTTPAQAGATVTLSGPNGYASHSPDKTPLTRGAQQFNSEITQAGAYTNTITVYDATGKQTGTVTKTFTVAAPPQDGPPTTPPCPKPSQ